MVIGLAILSLTLQATGQTARPSSSERQAAKRLFAKASGEYAQQSYEAALGDFTAAYRLARVPEILYNLGQCHYELHQWRRAAYYYRRFLEARPHAAVADQVRTRLADLDQMEAAPPPVVTPIAPPPVVPTVPIPAVTEPEPVAPPEPAGPSHALSLTLAGGAAICAVVGVFGVLRVAAYSNLSSQWQPGKQISEPNYHYAQQTYTNAQNWEWGATGLFVLTAGGVVGSVLTW